MKRQLQACVKEDACRLDLFMKKEFQLTSRQISQAKFRHNGILVNGVQRRVTEMVYSGECVEVLLEDSVDQKIIPTHGKLDILYEDQDLLIINKPAGMVIHPSHGHYQDSLLNHAAGYLKECGQQPVLRAVGRLDKDTSGVVVFAKNQVAAGRLAEQKECGIFQKEYLAITSAIPVEMHGTIDTPMERDPESLMKMRVTDQGMTAITHYEVWKTWNDRYALIRIRIKTGRTHQIRVHMASIGCPLVGDPLYNPQFRHSNDDINGVSYGRDESGVMNRTALHAECCILSQPFSGEQIKIHAELPSDFHAFVHLCMEE